MERNSQEKNANFDHESFFGFDFTIGRSLFLLK
jgi:hypothetical protein